MMRSAWRSFNAFRADIRPNSSNIVVGADKILL